MRFPVPRIRAKNRSHGYIRLFTLCVQCNGHGTITDIWYHCILIFAIAIYYIYLYFLLMNNILLYPIWYISMCVGLEYWLTNALPIYYYVMFDIFRILTQCIPVPLKTQDTDLHLPSVLRTSLRSGVCVSWGSSQAVCHTRAQISVSVLNIDTRTISFGKVPQWMLQCTFFHIYRVVLKSVS